MSVFGTTLVKISKCLEDLRKRYPDFRFELVIYTDVEDPIRMVTYRNGHGYWTHILSEVELKQSTSLLGLINDCATYSMKALTTEGVPTDVH